ncbi:hypothetical protein F0562_012711 [Nyssa sinensis]|uniref:Uncharacterized protein n=1 Tax=Nyssa sinensis TaxID=561372 RepID=A0A5J4ZTA1_9ASTE|nr:hypothetical protein F0562_012711 [Nyssa sinensis]
MMCQLCGANIRGRGSSETTLVSIVANPVQSPPNFPEGPGKDDKLPDNNEIIGATFMCLGDKVEEGVVKEITPEESDLAHRSEDLEERVDTGSTMVVTEGDLFCDKQMTPNKAANPKKRGEPEKSSKSKRSGAGAMTLTMEDPPLVLTTLNEE